MRTKVVPRSRVRSRWFRVRLGSLRRVHVRSVPSTSCRSSITLTAAASSTVSSPAYLCRNQRISKSAAQYCEDCNTSLCRESPLGRAGLLARLCCLLPGFLLFAVVLVLREFRHLDSDEHDCCNFQRRWRLAHAFSFGGQSVLVARGRQRRTGCQILRTTRRCSEKPLKILAVLLRTEPRGCERSRQKLSISWRRVANSSRTWLPHIINLVFRTTR